MMKTRKFTRMLSSFTAASLALSMVGFEGISANAETANDYTLTIPSTLAVANIGWNKTDGISAKGTLNEGYKLTVTAISENDFALANTSYPSQKIHYTMKEDVKDKKVTTSWSFDSLDSEALTTKPLGIDVEDYSNMSEGTYQDIVTFTASVTRTLTLSGNNHGEEFTIDLDYTDDDTWRSVAGRYDSIEVTQTDIGSDLSEIKFFDVVMVKGEVLSSNESDNEYNLVKPDDKVSAYNSYFLGLN